MAKGDFQKGVSALMKQDGLSRAAAIARYKAGDRAVTKMSVPGPIPSDPQELIGNLKGSSPAELAEMADALLLACRKDLDKAQSVLKFVSEISAQ